MAFFDVNCSILELVLVKVDTFHMFFYELVVSPDETFPSSPLFD